MGKNKHGNIIGLFFKNESPFLKDYYDLTLGVLAGSVQFKDSFCDMIEYNDDIITLWIAKPSVTIEDGTYEKIFMPISIIDCDGKKDDMCNRSRACIAKIEKRARGWTIRKEGRKETFEDPQRIRDEITRCHERNQFLRQMVTLGRFKVMSENKPIDPVLV